MEINKLIEIQFKLEIQDILIMNIDSSVVLVNR